RFRARRGRAEQHRLRHPPRVRRTRPRHLRRRVRPLLRDRRDQTRTRRVPHRARPVGGGSPTHPAGRCQRRGRPWPPPAGMRVRASRPTTDDRTPGRAAERPARAFRALTRTICGVALQLFDTAARQVREFRPARSGTASMYICGATVQGVPHIGHVRGALNYDVLRRWLVHSGLDVLMVRNVTDIDDKILTKAAEAGRPWWEWAATHERAFEDAYAALG